MSLALALMAIPGVALAAHRIALWWSRRGRVTRTSLVTLRDRPMLCVAVPGRILHTEGLRQSSSLRDLLESADAALESPDAARSAYPAAVDAHGTPLDEAAIGERLKANGYFPTTIDPLRVEPKPTFEEVTRILRHFDEIDK